MCVFEPCAFWGDFFANLFPDLLVGGLLGGLLTWLLGKRLGLFELAQQRKDESRTEIERAIRYLELIRKDTDKFLTSAIPTLRDCFSKGVPRLVELTYWEILQSSGEPSTLLDVDILVGLAGFYGRIAYIRQESYNIAWHQQRQPDPKIWIRFVAGLDWLDESGEHMLAELDAEICRLRQRLAEL